MTACSLLDLSCQVSRLAVPLLVAFLGFLLIAFGKRKGLVLGLLLFAGLGLWYIGVPPLGVPPLGGLAVLPVLEEK